MFDAVGLGSVSNDFAYFPELVASDIEVTLAPCRRAVDDPVQFLDDAVTRRAARRR